VKNAPKLRGAPRSTLSTLENARVGEIWRYHGEKYNTDYRITKNMGGFEVTGRYLNNPNEGPYNLHARVLNWEKISPIIPPFRCPICDSSYSDDEDYLCESCQEIYD
jgi:hypothetical protein